MVKNMLDGLHIEPMGVWQLEGFVLHNADPHGRIMVASAEKKDEQGVDVITLRLSFIDPPAVKDEPPFIFRMYEEDFEYIVQVAEPNMTDFESCQTFTFQGQVPGEDFCELLELSGGKDLS